MKYKEIQALQADELQAREGELGKEVLDARFSHAISQLADTARLGRVRRDLARVKTEINARRKKSAGGAAKA